MENVFGICATRFRIFRRPMASNVTTVIEITKAVVALHNFLMYGRSFEFPDYCPNNDIDQENGMNIIDGAWRNEPATEGLMDISKLGSMNYSKEAKAVREDFRDYFNSEESSVAWQWDMVNRFDVQ